MWVEVFTWSLFNDLVFGDGVLQLGRIDRETNPASDTPVPQGTWMSNFFDLFVRFFALLSGGGASAGDE